MSTNLDHRVVEAFGEEWTCFDQQSLSKSELRQIFDQYFGIFPWSVLPVNAVGFDLGCGSGRWARVVGPRVGMLHCIDASEAVLDVAKRTLRQFLNCTFHHASVDAIPLADNSMDFGYSLGVLHHIPDTAAGIRSCVKKLKTGSPLLLYLYYAFDNRPMWFRLIWRATDLLRRAISSAPFFIRYPLSQAIASLVYWPMARLSKLVEHFGVNVESIPLSWYRDLSFYTMRTDALDRFGTRIERRFTATEIVRMMEEAGLERITLSNSMPFWCAVGYKKPCAE